MRLKYRCNYLLVIALSLTVIACKQTETKETPAVISSADTVQATIQSEPVEEVEAEPCLSSFLEYTSKEELVKEFGEENVESSVQWFEEGTVKKEVAILYKETNKEISFVWDSLVSTISISGNNSHWSTKCGISLGMSLKELEQKLGGEVQFYGFAWDQSGYVKLDTCIQASKTHIYMSLAEEGFSDASSQNLMGERLMSSKDVVKPEFISVGTIIMELNKE